MNRRHSKTRFAWAVALTVGLWFWGSKPPSCPAFSQTWDFEGQVGREWSSSQTFNVDGNRILGLFNDQNVTKYPAYTTLTLRNIPANTSLVLSFELFLVGTWDSEGKLADRWTLSVKDGKTLLELTRFDLASQDGSKVKPTPKTGRLDTGRRFLDYSVVDHRISIGPESIRNGELSLVFRGYLTGRGTEFWALDNVRIEAAKK